MKTILAFLLLTSTAAGQSFVVTDRQQSFVVTDRVAATPAAIEPDYIVCFSGDSCPPCRAWKKLQAPKLEAAGHRIRYVDITVERQWGISCIPTIWLCDGKTRTKKREWVGAVTSETLLQAIQTTDLEPQLGDTANDSQRQQHHAGSPSAVRFYDPPNRYIQWPGWGQIDLQTYDRNCNCPMCVSIRARQQDYQRQLQAYQQTSLPDDQQPCPMATVEAMLDAMQLTPADTLVDLGCGDGRILIAAAKRGIRGIGVELDHVRAEIARQAVRDSDLVHMVSIVTGDARNFDTSSATAITAFLYPTLLAELAPKMAKARVAASPFHEVPGLAMIRVGDVWVYRKV